MGSYAAKDAIIAAKAFIKSLPIDVDFNGNVGVPRTRIMNDALSLVWNYAPWRFAVKLTALTPIVNDQDTLAVSSTGFKVPVGAWLLNGDAAGSTTFSELGITSFLPSQTIFKGPVRRIAYDGATATFDPCPTGYPLPVPQLLIAHSTLPLVITTGNESTAGAFPIPDEWYFVYQAAVLYYAYLYADDPRAGSGQGADNAPMQATGQFGTVIGMLEMMKAREVFQLDIRGQEIVR